MPKGKRNIPETTTEPTSEVSRVDASTDSSRVEVIREAHDPKFVAGLPGKRDKYKMAEARAKDMREGDVPAWAIAKSGGVESADSYKEQYGCTPAHDKDGKEIRYNELILTACPRSEYEAKIAEERRQSGGKLAQNERDAEKEGLFDARDRGNNKKYFT